ncbi:DMT family transporter [Sphingomonas qomolangmaensis]|uniref:DMT family transporter n=1 Tax=Sphingomonas qomolangmaensis TaxID=2918765 RepID=A0ABY5LD57_9SPHN|nr:DMT family transporter [Sphingomonas qomolangmaensis]UUL83598.1 DMT family transporter [Sphingomonas qomolangmaensis]
MGNLIPILAALLGGIGLAVQPPTNAALGRSVGSVLVAALLSFAIGTAILFAIWLAADRTPLANVRSAKPWMLLGGLYGAYFVAAAAFAAPRLGLASMLTIMIASQLVAALVLDQFGLFGLDRAPVSLARVAGVVFVLVGVVLVRRG